MEQLERTSKRLKMYERSSLFVGSISNELQGSYNIGPWFQAK